MREKSKKEEKIGKSWPLDVNFLPGRDEWELLTDMVGAEQEEYLISYGNGKQLKASTSYKFRVTAENEGSISFPTAPSESHNTPRKFSLHGKHGDGLHR